jgi:acyl carrier protein
VSNLESELAELIVDALVLEDVKAEDIDPTRPLFSEGLGLDSVDALELAIAIHKKYGVQIKADDPSVRETFQSLRSLAAHIEAERGAAS